MFHRRPRIADVLVAAVLLISSIEVRGDSEATDCPCEFCTLRASCYKVSEAPQCLLSKNISVLTLELVNVTKLTAPVLANVPRVRSLHITSDSLTTIGSSAFTDRNPELRELKLDIPKMTTLEPKILRSLPELRYLHFESDVQRMGEDQLEMCPDQTGLIIEGWSHKIRRVTCNNKALITVEPVDNVPQSLIAGDSESYSVYLADNGIQSISVGAFRSASKLLLLDLSRNHLKTIEEGTLDDAESLLTFDATENEITSLPPTIFARTMSLLEIFLNSNKLTSLPRDLFATTVNLTYLSLSSNQLEALEPGLLRHNHRLKALNLEDNAIKALSADAFVGLRKLSDLFVGNNRLASLPAELFRPTFELELLEMRGNLLQELPEKLLANLPDLKMVQLDNNQLKRLPGRLFENSSRLFSVSLKHNNLSSLPAELFSTTPHVIDLWLEDNPWDCTSCDVAAMAAWMRSYDIDIGDVAPRCGGDGSELLLLETETGCSSTVFGSGTRTNPQGYLMDAVNVLLRVSPNSSCHTSCNKIEDNVCERKTICQIHI